MTITTPRVRAYDTTPGPLRRVTVHTPAGWHYGDGYAHPHTPGTQARFWMRPDLILAASELMDRHATIVCDGAQVRDHEVFSDELRAAGWKHSKVAAWTTYHRDDGRTVSIGLRASMEEQHYGTLFGPGTDPGVLAMQLDRYANAVGTGWRGTPATSSLAALRLSWENVRGEPLWKLPKSGPGFGVGAMLWERELNEFEASWGYVHTFDLNNAYLSALINAEVARSHLENVGPQMYDERLPGYWLLQLDTRTLELLADKSRPPLLTTVLKHGQAWVTTPYAKLLRELGDRLEVVDSWTACSAPGHAPGVRAFRKVGERLRDALQAAQPGAPWVPAVKATYKDMPGALQRESMRVFRPDWAHAVIDLARANLYRRMIRIRMSEGVWPVRVATDSLSYADCVGHVEHWRTVLPIAPGLGHFKHEHTHTSDAWEIRKRGKREPVEQRERDESAVGDGAGPGRHRPGPRRRRAAAGAS